MEGSSRLPSIYFVWMALEFALNEDRCSGSWSARLDDL
jgi:hypothetical protein